MSRLRSPCKFMHGMLVDRICKRLSRSDLSSVQPCDPCSACPYQRRRFCQKASALLPNTLFEYLLHFSLPVDYDFFPLVHLNLVITLSSSWEACHCLSLARMASFDFFLDNNYSSESPSSFGESDSCYEESTASTTDTSDLEDGDGNTANANTGSHTGQLFGGNIHPLEYYKRALASFDEATIPSRRTEAFEKQLESMQDQ